MNKSHKKHGHEPHHEVVEPVEVEVSIDEDQDEVVEEVREARHESEGSELNGSWPTLVSIFHKWQGHWKLFTGIMIVGTIAMTIVAIIGGVGIVGAGLMSGIFQNAATAADVLSELVASPALLTTIITGAVVFAAVIMVIYTWMALAQIAAWRFVFGEEHHEMSIRNAYRSTWALVPSYIWISILSTLLVVVGVIGFILPGLALGLCFTLLPAIAVVEERKGMGALKRAIALVRPKIFSVLWRFVIVGLIVYVPASIVFSILGQIFNDDLKQLLDQLFSIVAGPIFGGVVYVTFLELKALHQGEERHPKLIKIAFVAAAIAVALLIILAAVGIW